MTSHTATVHYTPAAGRNPLLRALTAIGTFFDDLIRASEAAALYERLSVLSDAALEKRGLDRQSIARYAYETAFAR